MKIALLEPIGVSKEVIDELSAPITEKGHEFVYYDTKTTDPAELAKRSEGCDIGARMPSLCALPPDSPGPRY